MSENINEHKSLTLQEFRDLFVQAGHDIVTKRLNPLIADLPSGEKLHWAGMLEEVVTFHELGMEVLSRCCGTEAIDQYLLRIKELEQQLAESVTAHQKDLTYAKNQHDMFIKKLAEVTEWRPIESAPDDQVILLLEMGKYDYPIVGYYSDIRGKWGTFMEPFVEYSPTHWLPLVDCEPLPASNEVKE